jgi:hypothetical protein
VHARGGGIRWAMARDVRDRETQEDSIQKSGVSSPEGDSSLVSGLPSTDVLGYLNTAAERLEFGVMPTPTNTGDASAASNTELRSNLTVQDIESQRPKTRALKPT